MTEKIRAERAADGSEVAVVAASRGTQGRLHVMLTSMKRETSW
ncbi:MULTISPECIES: hypothetical protein [Actinoalloteichus]|uniref:Uncharacterized protein n=1 Tax=Actinoalloteichus fjordicus TaxID=1612552 RepID=A0AAC9LH94_9PSEU|nr:MULTISPECIES: hypothetical protein [Actinoalloteichus]APU17291.1 hypothetical protein UA74_26430 [Actinoalloteichus fjordicus]APU23374.1 hypothetical protein UA75_27015 [Actinoalloteichus sp. GBA129-24]